MLHQRRPRRRSWTPQRCRTPPAQFRTCNCNSRCVNANWPTSNLPVDTLPPDGPNLYSLGFSLRLPFTRDTAERRHQDVSGTPRRALPRTHAKQRAFGCASRPRRLVRRPTCLPGPCPWNRHQARPHPRLVIGTTVADSRRGRRLAPIVVDSAGAATNSCSRAVAATVPRRVLSWPASPAPRSWPP
jgi:hypothetical protein